MEAFVNIGLFLGYILFAVCVLTAVLMPLAKAFGDPQSLKKMGFGIGGLVLVFIVAYALSGGTATGEHSATTVKLVGAGITTFWILLVLAIIGIVYTEIKKAIG